LVSLVIHTNIGLENQRVCAAALKDGFAKHGIDAEVTPSIYKQADIHLIQGPWYAYKEWLGKPNVIWLDRCFYGCSKTVLSLGWLNPDGSRNFGDCDKPAKGELPELKPRKDYRGSCVVFGDYGRDMTAEIHLARTRHAGGLFFRPHPQDQTNPHRAMTLDCELSSVFEIADVAIGHGSTVLVDAKIAGLRVESTDWRHVINFEGDRETWLRQLSWKQWSLNEIRAGHFWEHLHDCNR